MSNPPKKRGAPLGNTNALKHGYYSPRFRPHLPPLDCTDLGAISDQLTSLRLYLHHIKTLSADLTSLSDGHSLLNVLNHAMASHNRLLRLQQRLYGTQLEKSHARATLLRALQQATTPADPKDSPHD